MKWSHLLLLAAALAGLVAIYFLCFRQPASRDLLLRVPPKIIVDINQVPDPQPPGPRDTPGPSSNPGHFANGSSATYFAAEGNLDSFDGSISLPQHPGLASHRIYVREHGTANNKNGKVTKLLATTGNHPAKYLTVWPADTSGQSDCVVFVANDLLYWTPTNGAPTQTPIPPQPPDDAASALNATVCANGRVWFTGVHSGTPHLFRVSDDLTQYSRVAPLPTNASGLLALGNACFMVGDMAPARALYYYSEGNTINPVAGSQGNPLFLTLGTELYFANGNAVFRVMAAQPSTAAKLKDAQGILGIAWYKKPVVVTATSTTSAKIDWDGAILGPFTVGSNMANVMGNESFVYFDSERKPDMPGKRFASTVQQGFPIQCDLVQQNVPNTWSMPFAARGEILFAAMHPTAGNELYMVDIL